MTANEAISKIAEMLGMKFKSEKFFQTKLVDGTTTITNNQEGTFNVGEELMIVGEDGMMTPAPAGRHETREGLILEVGSDGIISKIENVETEEERVREASQDVMVDTEVMSKATLTDGTPIMTDEDEPFAPGQYAYVITQEGEKVGAPEGEHTTDSGIVLTIDAEHRITGVKYPDEAGEGSLEDMKKEMKKMKEAMSQMLSVVSEFNKELGSYKKDYEEFKAQPQFKTPVVEKKGFSKPAPSIIDSKFDFLKNTGVLK
jgi:hypothetical protein